MSDRILLIGAGNEGLDILSKANAYGLKVSHINQPSLFKDEFLEYLEDVVIIDYENIEKTITFAKLMHQQLPFCAVISLSENALVVTAHVTNALGLAGNSIKSVEALKDKIKMRTMLDSAGVSVVPFEKVSSRMQLQKFAQQTGYPIIVKPIDGTRSANVYKVCNSTELSDVFQIIEPMQIDHQFLCEKFLEGPEISVETFTFNGHHTIFAITDKLTESSFIEIGHSIPSVYKDTHLAEISHTIKGFLDTVGITCGPSHTELRLTPEGPLVIESHNRVGGDRINELVRLSYGLDMRAYTIGWQSGKEQSLLVSPSLQKVSAIRFITAEPGIVESVDVDAQVYESVQVQEFKFNMKPGDIVNELHSSSDRLGHIIVTGDSLTEVHALLDTLIDSIRIKTYIK